MTACFFCSVIPGFISLISAIEFLSFKSSIASDFLIHSTVMHIFLLGVFPDYGIGDGIYGAAKLIQLGKLALNLQLFWMLSRDAELSSFSSSAFSAVSSL